MAQKNECDSIRLSNLTKNITFELGCNQPFEVYSSIYVYDHFQRRVPIYNGLLKFTIGNESNGMPQEIPGDEDSSTGEQNSYRPEKLSSSATVISVTAKDNQLAKAFPNDLDSFNKIRNKHQQQMQDKEITLDDQALYTDTEIFSNNNNSSAIDEILQSVNTTYIKESQVSTDIILATALSEDNISKDIDYESLLETVPITQDISFSSIQPDKDFEDFSNPNNYVDTINIREDHNDFVIHNSVISNHYYKNNEDLLEELYHQDPDDAIFENDESLSQSFSFNAHEELDDFNNSRDSSNRKDTVCPVCERNCRSINALNHHMLVHSEERPYVCKVCKKDVYIFHVDKAFKEQPTLRRHMWTHMEKQHQCDICKKYFVEKSSLRRHMSTIHADFKPGAKVSQHHPKQLYCCAICNKIFKSQTKYNMHVKLHGDPDFECSICNKVYAGRSHLKIHERIHTGEKPFTCTICDSKFAFKHVLKSHQARIHQRINKFKCNICSLAFIKKSELSNHVSCHMLNVKKGRRHFISSKNMRKNNNVADVKHLLQKNMTRLNSVSPKGESYELFAQLVGLTNEKLEENVSQEFSPEIQMISDLVMKTDPDSVKLESFEMTAVLGQESTADQEKKEKKCQRCSKKFERMADLKRHLISHIVQIAAISTKDGNHGTPHYECGICGNAEFNQVDKYKAHLREHAKLTLYKCKHCGRAFGDSSNYSKHKKVHGNKYLQCDICRRKFNTKRMLISHMDYHRSNQPKTCTYCNRLFHFESNLRKHLKMSHQGKANVTYKCENCGGRFRTVKQKWEHQWEVHQIRKVKADCDLCSAKFRKVSLLRAHMTKDHVVQLHFNDDTVNFDTFSNV